MLDEGRQAVMGFNRVMRLGRAAAVGSTTTNFKGLFRAMAPKKVVKKGDPWREKSFFGNSTPFQWPYI